MTSSSSSPSLQCRLQCGDTNHDDGTSSSSSSSAVVYDFRPDAHKKSAFWLGQQQHKADDPPSQQLYSMAHPAQAVLFSDSAPWAVGGFQLVSNARSVKVYLTTTTTSSATTSTTQKMTKEDYLTTVKGLPVVATSSSSSRNDTASIQLFKAMCVIPGGVRPVVQVRLEFEQLGLAPSSNKNNNEETPTTLMKLQWIKLTARMVTQTKPQPPQPQQQQQQQQTKTFQSEKGQRWQSQSEAAKQQCSRKRESKQDSTK
mmetsp:Transcript_30557/g.71542  ORF Transcript_30557/g.71542 Transcript_30557/m.71542 type:complete len:257 (-) Transcript_30557:228-998(-)